MPHDTNPITLAAAAIALAWPTQAPAADLPPALVAGFTRSVQPLLLNKCAAGACHGGPGAPAMQLHRFTNRGGVERRGTLANLQAFLDVVGPSHDPQPLMAMLARRHPASAPPAALVVSPLSSHERATIETWLAAVHAVRFQPHRDPAVRQAGGATAVAPPPNRFRDLLEQAADPPALPPPEEPRGIIFPRDKPPEDLP
jgi:hypothetical protein